MASKEQGWRKLDDALCQAARNTPDPNRAHRALALARLALHRANRWQVAQLDSR
jgi:hypothetical protein